MKKETLKAAAVIVGNGYKCFVHNESEEVFSVEDISLEKQKSGDFKLFVPLEGPVTFGLMEEYTASVEDFEKQSELMEAIMYEKPFLTFKRKVYQIGLAEDWIAFRTKKIVAIFNAL